MKILLLALVMLFSCSLLAQHDTSLLKRSAYKLILPVVKGTVYDADINAGPYILPDTTLQLFANESIFLEVETDGDNITGVTAVATNTHPEKTLSISFKQITEKGAHQMMMLTIENPFKKDLQYSASILLMRPKKWITTDVLPVKAGLQGFETWPDILVSIGLKGWAFVK